MAANHSANEHLRRPRLLGEDLIRRLEDDIIHLRFAPGARLVEEEICNRFGVSRSPVREALQILASYGLVERQPRVGIFVTELTARKLDEVYACRVSLEAMASAGVARRASPRTIASIAALVAEMGKAIEADERDRAFAANVALTDKLHAECGNETLRQILSGLDKQALRYRLFCYRHNRDLVLASTEANASLLAAIKSRAPEQASSVTQDLVTRSWQMIRATLVAQVGDDTAKASA
ncbi:GntR family transcriptional regulator [Labrys monachus]|uniref:DNA-binding GntR family transcriptional regulator n=1 Tax=Labrys monachus TaxID=217067 RepID=A0ABU0FFH9_9HYPH|nr:GntR family transcriptional regulator [Labrys monachus]MDQ0393358.1 DNA-binding GntR family transcriptional regulator [Labrys monachus]